MKSIDSYIERYSKIQDAISNSTLYQEAIDSFKTGLKDFSFTPQEQANAYATFIAQTTIGLQAQSMEMALRIELTEIQSNDLRNKSAIETQILKSQALTNAINVSTAQATLEASKSSALQEKIKCQVLIKSANDNTEINKCNALVEYMNIIGNATNYANITSAKLHESIKNSILSIGKDGSLKSLNNTDENWIEEEAKRVIIYAPKTTLSPSEIGIFGIIHNIEGASIEWDFDGEKFVESEIMEYAFKTDGYKTVKVSVKAQEKVYEDNLRVYVGA